MFGRLPSSNQVYFYDSLWTAIYAIELAGTDTDLVAIGRVARSGNLEWGRHLWDTHAGQRMAFQMLICPWSKYKREASSSCNAEVAATTLTLNIT